MIDPVFTNDAIVYGILMSILGFVFITSTSKKPLWLKFYKYVPALLLCYFIPSIFNLLLSETQNVAELHILNRENTKFFI